MTPKSRLFQAGFSAALAIAFIVSASPARAEPITLSCRSDAGSETWTLRINYATGLIEQLADNGTAYTNRVATATISPNAIVWVVEGQWGGRIDRLSATGMIMVYGDISHEHLASIAIACRQATKPKF